MKRSVGFLLLLFILLSSCVILKDLERKDGMVFLPVADREFAFFGDYLFHNSSRYAFKESPEIAAPLRNLRKGREVLFSGHTVVDPYCGVIIIEEPSTLTSVQRMKIPFITEELIEVDATTFHRQVYKVSFDDISFRFFDYSYVDNGRSYMISFWTKSDHSSWLDQESRRIISSFQ